MSGSNAPDGRNDDLIFDWNNVGRRYAPFGHVEFFDETLRDGIQNPSVKDPTIDDKLELLHLMNSLGIHVADIGLPGSSKRAFDDVLRMCREVVDQKMTIRIACAGRTVPSDITPMVEISQRAGLPIEVYTFIGSSPIRVLAEDWDLASMLKKSADAIDVGVKAGLPVCYVTEDTIRSKPEVLAAMFKNAVDHGASRLCLCDTVGHATPDGVRALINFARSVVAGMGAPHVKIDWHGHNDRGLGLVNALFAIEYGADRVHATGLGIGERVGNTPMELMLLNLKLADALPDQDLSNLLKYCQTVSRATGFPIPISYPLVGRDAFRTSTGVHAAAIIKAQNKGDAWLADRIYSGVPAGMFGRRQEIEIGPMSGASNVTFWLRQHAIEPAPELVQLILQSAKGSDHVLTPDELHVIVARWKTPRAAS